MTNTNRITEIAWAAGLLEGEGCFLEVTKKSPNGEMYFAWKLACNMCDLDVLQKLQSIAGGKIAGPFFTEPHHKPHYRWAINKRAIIESFLCEIVGSMGERRRGKIEKILLHMNNQPTKTWTHGTRWGYEGHGCRCKKCMQAHARRCLAQARKRGRPAKTESKHGTRSKYVKGCRCDSCRAAALAYERKRASHS